MTNATKKAKTVSTAAALALAASNTATVPLNKVETIVSAAPTSGTETITAAPAAAAGTVVNKASIARTVFAEAYPDGKTTSLQRKEIINQMVAKAGLTPAGAATYLQNFKKAAGIVQPRAAATA